MAGIMTRGDVTTAPGFNALSDHDQDVLVEFEQSASRSGGRPRLEAYFDGDLHLLAPRVNDREDFLALPDGGVAVATGMSTRLERENQ
jgi:hypothetical protein